jgi:hypothetical protein
MALIDNSARQRRGTRDHDGTRKTCGVDEVNNFWQRSPATRRY